MVKAQEIKSYEWAEKPVFQPIPEEYKNQPAIALLDKREVYSRVGQYTYASFIMNHLAIKINNAEEISKYNTVKVEENGFIRTVRDFHARIIKPNGEIKIIPQDKIIETEVGKVKSIVFEGVEAGDILEYYFILKKFPRSYDVEVFQRQIPILEAEYKITMDGAKIRVLSSEIFELSVNQNAFSSDTQIYRAKNIIPFVKESDAANLKNLVKIIYIAGQFYKFDLWDYSLNEQFNNIHFNYFNQKIAKSFIQNLNLNDLSVDEKLIKLDQYIKENFDFIKRGEKPAKIKNLSEGKLKLIPEDIFELYVFALKELKIPSLGVVGMNRFSGTVHETTHFYPISHDFVFYIPEIKKFISPYDRTFTYGLSDYNLQSSYGLSYDNKLKAGSRIAKFEFPVTPLEYTSINTQTKVVLKEDLTTLLLNTEYASTGYNGLQDRMTLQYLKENEEEKVVLDYVKNTAINEIDVKLLEHSFENQEIKNNYSNVPFVMKVKMETNEAFTENAGNLLLINIGKIIGKQINLFQETERKNDIDLKYTQKFQHKITFMIPNGYSIESYKDLIYDVKMNYDENKTCYFKSTSKIEGSELIVEIEGANKDIHYSKSLYDEYRKVINASADFYKSSIILKPKK
jgi:hypothetical protein